MRATRWALLVIGFAASIASAQRTRHTQPATAPRLATITPAPAAAVPAQYLRTHYGHGEFRSDVPILFKSDGRVFADFGRGWESVSRSCSMSDAHESRQIVSPSALQQPVVVQPTVTQPSAPGVQRLPYTPPVPAQQTASQQMAEQGGRLSPASGVGQSCWARAHDGRILVTQP